MKLSDKLILVDCDGVLVDWVYSFDRWMERHGHKKIRDDVYDLAHCYDMEKADVKKYIKMFNESANIEYLPPLRDAVKYVKKLHEECGYIFHCITSLSLDPYAQKARVKNIEALFGPTAFEKIVCLDTGADKDEALAEYKDSGCFWLEDKEEYAIAGLNAGLRSLLIEHEYNKNFDHGDIIKVNCWREFYDIISK